MKWANKLGAKWVVLLTPDTAKRRAAQLREMTSGEQTELDWVELPTRLA
jgi:histidyl-tRNA synthetase